VSAWYTAESSPVLLVPRVAPKNSGCDGLVITGPHSSVRGGLLLAALSSSPGCRRRALEPQPAFPSFAPLPSVAKQSTLVACGPAALGLSTVNRSVRYCWRVSWRAEGWAIPDRIQSL